MFYIRATGSISPQKTFGNAPFLGDPIHYTGDRLTCIEPDYTTIIDAKLIRRMSRIIKMGVAAALECLKEAGITQPDAIVTGTAYGCLQDTEVFLTRIVENKEEMLTPTAFIQSTHNTVGAQIALMLQCHNYNNTFVHRGFSFESALLDAMTLLLETPEAHVLVGGVDEITTTSHAILSRLGFYRQGAAAGEGAAFFLLAGQPAPKSSGQQGSTSTGQTISTSAGQPDPTSAGQPAPTDYARLEALSTFYNPRTPSEAQQSISSFLKAQSIDMQDIDLILTGRNGDEKNDAIYQQLGETIFKGRTLVDYKNLCGEYPTSSAFALWMAANMLKTGQMPDGAPDRQPVRKILIYNHYLNRHHSLFLVSAC